jgi:hypothetical protein
MSNPATDIDGDLIVKGQQASIHGAVTAVSGSGVNASVTVVTILGDTFTCLAGDLSTPDDPQIAANPGRTNGGNAFATNDQVVVNGQIIAIANGPLGINGTATIVTDNSRTTVVVSTGSLQVNG